MRDGWQVALDVSIMRFWGSMFNMPLQPGSTESLQYMPYCNLKCQVLGLVYWHQDIAISPSQFSAASMLALAAQQQPQPHHIPQDSLLATAISPCCWQPLFPPRTQPRLCLSVLGFGQVACHGGVARATCTISSPGTCMV